MRVCLIVNPAARAGSGDAPATRAATRLRAAGVDVETVTPADAAGTAAAVDTVATTGVDAVLVAGGDGTVGLALARLRGGIPLGIVPTGTGNDLARALGLAADDDALVDAVRSGTTRRIDLAVVTDAAGRASRFATVFASGFDSRVNDRANRMRWPRGPLRYTLAILLEFLVLRAIPYVIELEHADGTMTRIEEELLVAAVGNSRSYGGGIPICPDAILDDGLLDVTLIRSAGRLRLLRLLRSVYAGTHTAAPEVRTFRVRAVSLAAPGSTGYADGEPLGALPVRISVEPAAVTVLAAR
ncbi:YegS/Rv2252/BmrU family lipid kinase [Microbacterium dauci]|uniref:YegS/Rv2252/BmrU family lipid kinase n=1 Tax=Microbacterium dauci TaxID=3048008 RepID=A0ABT6ZAF6_9MICO|nr:YegS/Rv2252/BmrU family lipid kinase [Microbacterium sp. LX3-4]MDJ1112981.1 YegS/Rv2252/BmrU family lipid kinase [Microbacterium sp. LX3-4]